MSKKRIPVSDLTSEDVITLLIALEHMYSVPGYSEGHLQRLADKLRPVFGKGGS